jgi:bifunctional non-homologous end joining protein LigD
MRPTIEPMQLRLVPEPFSNKDWLFEIKHDGFRAIAYVFDGKCDLVSRRRIVYKRFRELGEEIARSLKVKNAVLDGEICCFDDEGRSLFGDLMFRRSTPTYYVFDLIWLNDKDLRMAP